jgi:hypothetical protein
VIVIALIGVPVACLPAGVPAAVLVLPELVAAGVDDEFESLLLPHAAKVSDTALTIRAVARGLERRLTHPAGVPARSSFMVLSS